MLQLYKDGKGIVDVELTADAQKGDVIVSDALIVVSAEYGTTGQIIACYTEGTFKSETVTEETALFGSKAYWDATNNLVTNTDNAGANKQIGVYLEAKTVGSEVATIGLNL